MPIPVDVLIVGAGVQGMLLLRRLVQDYSVVVAGSSPRHSETLHSHGTFASGWNAGHPTSARIYHHAALWWRELLERHNIQPKENEVYRSLPARSLDKLSAVWREAGIPFKLAALPSPFDTSRWPSHKTILFPDDLVFDASAAMRELRHPFEQHVIGGSVKAIYMDGDVIAEVVVKTLDGDVTFAPALVCACAGAGNASLLRMMGLSDDVVANSQLTRVRHMVCARGKTLPNVSLYAQELTLIAHPLSNGDAMWLVTYDSPKPQFIAGEVDMTIDPPVSSDIVRGTLDRLKLLLPDFVERASQCEWSVYAGWKTDAPGDDALALLRISTPKPYDVKSFGISNFFAVWPNHWGLATPASQEVATVVRESLRQQYDLPDLPMRLSQDNDATHMKFMRADRDWQTWQQFSATHDAT